MLQGMTQSEMYSPFICVLIRVKFMHTMFVTLNMKSNEINDSSTGCR